MSSTKIIKFITGLEVVGEIYEDESNEKTTKVSDCFQMISQQGQFGLVPFLPMGDNTEKVDINNTAIAFSYTVNPKIKDMYNDTLNEFRAANGGIIKPKKSSIILNP